MVSIRVRIRPALHGVVTYEFTTNLLRKNIPKLSHKHSKKIYALSFQIGKLSVFSENRETYLLSVKLRCSVRKTGFPDPDQRWRRPFIWITSTPRFYPFIMNHVIKFSSSILTYWLDLAPSVFYQFVLKFLVTLVY